MAKKQDVTREIHCIEFVNTDLTYCGLDPYELSVAPEDPLELTEGVTCEACLAAIQKEEEEEERTLRAFINDPDAFHEERLI